jgi:hypothetical protein
MKEGAYRRNPELMCKEEVVPDWCQAFKESRGALAAKAYVGTEIQLQQGGACEKKRHGCGIAADFHGVEFRKTDTLQDAGLENVSFSGGCPTMSASVQRSPMLSGNGRAGTAIPLERGTSFAPSEEFAESGNGNGQKRAARVYVAAENRLLREALSRMLVRHGDIEAVGMNSETPFRTEALIEEKAEILLMTSRGNMPGDLALIRRIRLTAPSVRIPMIGVTEDDTEFFQLCARRNSGLPA